MSTTQQPPQTAVEKRNQELAASTHDLLKKLEPAMKKVLPKHLTPERMAMIAFTAMRRTPKLMQCSQASIIGSIMTAAMLGLEPSGPLGHGALIPYGTECQFQPMYQGLLELARRSGLVRDIQARVVYKGDHYVFRYGLDPTIEHIPMEGDGAENPNREATHVYCIIRFVNGGVQWEQMSMKQVLAHAMKFSPSWQEKEKAFKADSAWAKHPEAMGLKTVIKRVLKMSPKSPEMADAMMIDDMADMGVRGKTKQRDDGTYEVDFSDAFDAETDPAPRGTVNVEQIRESESGGNRGHRAERLDEARRGDGAGQNGNEEGRKDSDDAGAGGNPPTLAEQRQKLEESKPLFARPDQDPKTKISETDMKLLENVMRTHKVDYDAFSAKVKSLGYKMVSQLTYAHFQQIGEWIRKGGKDPSQD
jgi:recombination protein RecT